MEVTGTSERKKRRSRVKRAFGSRSVENITFYSSRSAEGAESIAYPESSTFLLVRQMQHHVRKSVTLPDRRMFSFSEKHLLGLQKSHGQPTKAMVLRPRPAWGLGFLRFSSRNRIQVCLLVVRFPVGMFDMGIYESLYSRADAPGCQRPQVIQPHRCHSKSCS